LRESVLFGSVGEKAEVTDTHEAVGEHVEEKAADKLLGVKGHRLFLITIFAVPVAKSDLAVFDGEDAVIRQSDSVGVAAEIIKDRLWGAERFFGINHPVLFTQLFEFLACGRDFPLVEGLL
jgi:hypothetical protein